MWRSRGAWVATPGARFWRFVSSPPGLGRGGAGLARTSPRGVNPVVTSRVSYYGRFYRTAALNALLKRISTYLMRWARRKYKRLRSYKRVRRWLGCFSESPPCPPLAADIRILTRSDGTRGDEGRLSRSVARGSPVRFSRSHRRITTTEASRNASHRPSCRR